MKCFFIKQKSTVLKLVLITTIYNQTENTIWAKASTEITPYHAKATSTSRILSKRNQKNKGRTKVKESPVVHNLIDNEQTGKW